MTIATALFTATLSAGPSNAGPLEVGTGFGRDLASGVHGQVVIGPVCPVERPGYDCRPRGVRATVYVRRDGRLVARLGTDGAGRFRVRLPPGRYLVTAERPVGLMRRSPPARVDVRSGRYARVVLRFDSGLR